MAKIPGVPTLDPVSQPTMNPAQAGRPGEAISQLGQVGEDAAFQQQGLNLYIKKAQEHVDTLSARNEMDAAYAQIQTELAKTQNSRDIPDVIEQGNKTINEISTRWSKSPAAIAIQMDADALRPSMAHVGTVRQVDLMGKEFKINIAKQGEVLASDYASGNRTGAEAAFGAAVAGGVQTGLIGDAEAGEMNRQFRIAGQELEIRNGISNANPTVNQKTSEDLDHKEKFPDVPQEKIDIMKGQAQEAFERHTKQKDWAEGQMALNTQLVPKLQQFTNPGTGVFDEGAALKDNAERLVKGEITETQSRVLAEGFESHSAQLRVGIKQEGDKRLDHIENLLSAKDYKGAQKQMAHDQQWFEDNGLGNEYRDGVRYRNSMMAQDRAQYYQQRSINIEDRRLAQQEAEEQSNQVYGKMRLDMAEGKVFEPMDIWKTPGLSDKDRTTLLQEVKGTQDPHVKEGLVNINELGITDERKNELARIFVNQVKSSDARGSAITDVADKLIKQSKSQHSQEWIDQLYKKSTSPSDPSLSVERFMRPMPSSKSDGARIQQSPTTGKYRYTTDGGQTWHPGRPPQ